MGSVLGFIGVIKLCVEPICVWRCVRVSEYVRLCGVAKGNSSPGNEMKNPKFGPASIHAYRKIMR